jgi:hypothetical protein
VKERLFEVLDWRILRHRRITPGGRHRLIAPCGGQPVGTTSNCGPSLIQGGGPFLPHRLGPRPQEGSGMGLIGRLENGPVRFSSAWAENPPSDEPNRAESARIR